MRTESSHIRGQLIGLDEWLFLGPLPDPSGCPRAEEGKSEGEDGERLLQL
jgi:hypothetical protein